MSRKEARQCPLIEAFALLAWNTECNPWSSAERVSKGYIAQEIERRSHLSPQPSPLSK